MADLTILIENGKTRMVLSITLEGLGMGTWKQEDPMSRTFIAERWGYCNFGVLGGKSVLVLRRPTISDGKSRNEAERWAWLPMDGGRYAWKTGAIGMGCLWNGETGNEYRAQPQIGFTVLEYAPLDWTQIWVGAALHLDAQVAGHRGEIIVGSLINMVSCQWYYFLATATGGGNLPGAGASGSLAICVATKIADPSSLKGLQVSGEDYNVCLGVGWSKLLKWMGKSVALAKTVPTMAEIGEMAARDAKSEERLAQFKACVAAWGTDPKTPGFTCWDTPVGVGFEFSYSKIEGSIIWTAPQFDLPLIKRSIEEFKQQLRGSPGAAKGRPQGILDNPLKYVKGVH